MKLQIAPINLKINSRYHHQNRSRRRKRLPNRTKHYEMISKWSLKQSESVIVLRGVKL